MGQETWRHLITGSTIPGPAKVRAGSRGVNDISRYFPTNRPNHPSVNILVVCGQASQLPNFMLTYCAEKLVCKSVFIDYLEVLVPEGGFVLSTRRRSEQDPCPNIVKYEDLSRIS